MSKNGSERTATGVFITPSHELLEIEAILGEIYDAFLHKARHIYYEFTTKAIIGKIEGRIFLTQDELDEISKKSVALKGQGFASNQIYVSLTPIIATLQRLGNLRRTLLFESYQACQTYILGKLKEDDSKSGHQLFMNRKFADLTVKIANLSGALGKYHPKEEKLISLINLSEHRDGGVIVFLDDKEAIACLEQKIGAEFGIHKIATLSSNTSAARRRQVITDFKSGQIRIIFSTSTGETGLASSDISAVINYSLPFKENQYKNRQAFIANKKTNIYCLVMDVNYERALYAKYLKTFGLENQSMKKLEAQYALVF